MHGLNRALYHWCCRPKCMSCFATIQIAVPRCSGTYLCDEYGYTHLLFCRPASCNIQNPVIPLNVFKGGGQEPVAFKFHIAAHHGGCKKPCRPAAMSASCAFMLPVATAPNVIVFSTGRFTIETMAREGFALNWLGALIISTGCFMVLT